jgi:drug/metabolite transporter (DMT)-like permease
VLFVLGVQTGSAAIVATASGAYPMVTTLLAIVLLRERLAPNQYLGIAVLLAGLVTLGVVAG